MTTGLLSVLKAGRLTKEEACAAAPPILEDDLLRW